MVMGGFELTHFRFLTPLARDLRGVANIKAYFSFVYVSDSLGPSSEHNCGKVFKRNVSGLLMDE